MNIRETIIENFPDEEFIFLEGFDSAIIGVVEIPSEYPVINYDTKKIMEILQGDMSYEDAVEYFETAYVGKYLGNGTPAFTIKIEDMY